MKKISKKYKLPRKFWKKGKSKFVFIRAIEEGIQVKPHWEGGKSVESQLKS